MPQVAQYKIALCQLPVTADKHGNIARARARIDAAAAAGAKLVVLPEIWNCPYAMETMPSYAEDIDGGRSPSVSMLSEVAAARKITIVGGSVPEMASGQLFNTCCVVGPDGEIKAKHRKLHLFGIDIPGDITFREFDTFTAGQEPTVVDTDVGRIGIGICHDIRFPELAMLYRSRGAHLICYPSAFNMSTGQLLWDLMQKSRFSYLSSPTVLSPFSLFLTVLKFMEKPIPLNGLGFSCSWRPAHLRETPTRRRNSCSGATQASSHHLARFLRRQGTRTRPSSARSTCLWLKL
ncbi:omega-amidase, chloroplastic isoform X1 [Triticum aestivum]|uniref:omega-amidase, chloroplastic isoform X1 n=1 Tax=Triticum aestivum TaxID=4565 RepID=UPI001D002D43|nr:omega-amidase, chloroplastic-like isoform X1 [Triticum aestivum]XP_044431514.1 omega-amidase, chloroplastic-like isoform X1 [Triticum aestivum]